ncbi:MAG: metal-dependent transcriptional regulator [Candidatus Dormibacteria bacterium]
MPPPLRPGDPVPAAPSPNSTGARCLEAAYYIAHEGETVRPSRLAEWLGVSAPTVTGVLQRLHEQGLLDSRPDHSVTLTGEGERQAAAVVRRHRIVERWLTDTVGLDWASADEEAGRMAHAFSDTVLERLFLALGSPRTCPHGNEIPGAGLESRQLQSLAQLEPGRPAVISRISEVAEHQAPQLLRLLEAEGLKTGVQVEVRRPLGADAVTVLVAGRQTALGLGAAQAVWVEAPPR